jgi:hypothetical protein
MDIRWFRPGLALALVAVPAPALAFCGLYVAEPGQTVENHASQVILAHHDGKTTLTLASDALGDVTSFGLLVPIPEAIGVDDVKVADVALFDFLEQYTNPRVVSYTCDDLVQGGTSTRNYGCTSYDYAMSADDMDSSGNGPAADDSVTVEDRFTVGNYDIAVLSAEEAGGLSGWLGANGFASPTDRDGILQGYIDGGTHFLAVRVDTDGLETGQNWLQPLQFTYTADRLTLPIRIGTLSSSSTQDLIVYALTDDADGEVRVANYPEVTVEDECLWDADAGEDLTTWYDRRLDAAFGDEAGWIEEYRIPIIGQAYCDPCTTNSPLFVSDLPAYGWDGAASYYGGGYTSGAAYLTRIHLRYAADTAREDLVFETEGDQTMSQVRFIKRTQGMEAAFPVCDVGWVEAEQECQTELGPPSNGCDTPGGTQAAGGAFMVVAALLRRRARK